MRSTCTYSAYDWQSLQFTTYMCISLAIVAEDRVWYALNVINLLFLGVTTMAVWLLNLTDPLCTTHRFKQNSCIKCLILIATIYSL